jgi:hypothetical protein
MSGALTYLLLTRLKNQIKSLIKSPGKLLYVIFLMAMIGLTIFGANKSDLDPERVIRDIQELFAGITLFYSVMFAVIANKGFHNGASMFSMQDVNILFTAPFRPQKLLFYGLLRQIGISLMLGLFLLFQYSWLHSLYDLSYGTLLIVLLGYAVTVFLGQVTAMVIYSFTSSDEKKKTAAKSVFYAVFVIFAAYAAIEAFKSRDILAGAVKAANSAFVKLMPVSGWMSGTVSGIISGSGPDILRGVILSAVLLAGLICLITFKNQDYYEDVLKSTEIAQSAINARKEGVVGDAAPANVKLGRTGIGKGWGADVFYYKHKLEDRRSRVLILDKISLIFAACTIAFSFFMKNAGISAVFIFAVYMQVFTVALGRFNKELTKPYIYLMPEPPLRKMLYGLAEGVPSAIAEALLIFIPVAFILHMGPVETVLCILARITYSMLFTAGNVIVERLWGGAVSKMLVMFLFFATMIVLAAPGAVLAVILSSAEFIIVSEDVTVFLSMIICNIPIALTGLYLCRNMLQYAELNNR